jgi:hypothetical protein
VLGLAERTWARAPAWRSTIELFERDVAADPRHREGRLNLAVAYLLAGRVDDAKRHADALAAQRPAQEGWHSYALEPNLRALVCHVNAAAGRDADTLRAYPLEAPPAAAEIWRDPGFRACQAGALERLGRCALALPIYAQLWTRAGAGERADFALAAARCSLALGRAQEAGEWLARIPAEVARARGLTGEVTRLRGQLPRGGGPGS